MKRSVKKIISAGSAAVIAAAMLTACSSSSSTASSSQSSSAETEAATAAQTSAQAESSAASSSAKASYRIGICQLVQHEALDQATQGFEDALNELGEQNGVSFTFDLQNAQNDTNTCSTIANQFVSDGVDLIMANSTPSLQACSNATKEIPVLGTSVTSFPAALDIELDASGATGFNVSGTNDLAPLAEQAQMVKDLVPDAKNVGILYCSAEVNSAYQAEHIKESFDDLGLTYEDYSFSDSNDLQSVVTDAVANSDVIYIPTDNTAASNAELINNIAGPASVPIITGDTGTCKGCGLATFSVDFYQLGHRTGEMAYDILVNGSDVSSMPVEDPPALTRVYNPDIAEALGVDFSSMTDYSPLDMDQ